MKRLDRAASERKRCEEEVEEEVKALREQENTLGCLGVEGIARETGWIWSLLIVKCAKVRIGFDA